MTVSIGVYMYNGPASSSELDQVDSERQYEVHLIVPALYIYVLHRSFAQFGREMRLAKHMCANMLSDGRYSAQAQIVIVRMRIQHIHTCTANTVYYHITHAVSI